MSYFQTARKGFFDLLFPCFCLGCGKEGNYVCGSCRANLSFVPPACASCGALSPGTQKIPQGRTCLSCRSGFPLYGFLSPFSYDNAIARAIVHGCKYGRIPELGIIMGDFIADSIAYFRISLPAPLLAVPIPLHPRRYRVRGFNQAERIAQRVCERIGSAYAPECLARRKYTAPQVNLSSQRRRINMERAFFVPDEAALFGKDVLLLDDVKTTGATLEEAATALKQAGARKIWAATFAR